MRARRSRLTIEAYRIFIPRQSCSRWREANICITLSVRIGKGTLAPWDPTFSLVAVGPYRYTRNPMIMG